MMKLKNCISRHSNVLLLTVLELLVFLSFSGCDRIDKDRQASIDSINNFFKETRDSLRKQGKVDAILNSSFAMASKSKKIHYTEGVIKAYISIGNVLGNLKKNKESLLYLDRADEMNRKADATDLSALIGIEYGKNYYVLGFKDRAMEYYRNALEQAALVTDTVNASSLKKYVYGCLATAYGSDSTRPDSLYYYLTMAFRESREPFAAAALARFYTDNHKPDSAAYYLGIGDSLYAHGNFSIYQRAVLLKNRGYLELSSKNYDTAISLFEHSLGIFKKLRYPTDIKYTYLLLSKTYEQEEHKDEGNHYLKLYSELADSLNAVEKSTLSTSMKEMLHRQEEVFLQQKRRRLYYAVALGICLFVVGFIAVYKVGRKRDREVSRILDIKENEAVHLKQRINDSFEEVFEMAKENAPHFYIRFKEVYPDFHTKLLHLNPDLNLGELTLCAYIYLDFQTKEIAQYTSRSVKTIQNRKNSLRKRLRIDSNQDIYVWFKNISA
ncbi:MULTISPECIES: tetratricopeptide repeat protein [Chitinophagaceae]